MSDRSRYDALELYRDIYTSDLHGEHHRWLRVGALVRSIEPVEQALMGPGVPYSKWQMYVGPWIFCASADNGATWEWRMSDAKPEARVIMPHVVMIRQMAAERLAS